MTEIQNEQQPHSFKRKLGNTTYIVKVYFSKDTDKTFKHRVQKLIINECLEKKEEIIHTTTWQTLSETREWYFIVVNEKATWYNKNYKLKLMRIS